MINDLCQKVYSNAVAHGFYDSVYNTKDPIWLSNRLMLIVSEISEALEGVRHGNFRCEPQSGGLGEELADACIRIFDLAYCMGIDLEAAIEAKHKFNINRPYKHGNKAI